MNEEALVCAFCHQQRGCNTGCILQTYCQEDNNGDRTKYIKETVTVLILEEILDNNLLKGLR